MLVKLLIWVILGIVIYRAVRRLIGIPEPQERADSDTSVPVDDVMIKDPVCGVYFPRRRSVTAHMNGEVIHFCSAACRDLYLERKENNSG